MYRRRRRPRPGQPNQSHAAAARGVRPPRRRVRATGPQPEGFIRPDPPQQPSPAQSHGASPPSRGTRPTQRPGRRSVRKRETETVAETWVFRCRRLVGFPPLPVRAKKTGNTVGHAWSGIAARHRSGSEIIGRGDFVGFSLLLHPFPALSGSGASRDSRETQHASNLTFLTRRKSRRLSSWRMETVPYRRHDVRSFAERDPRRKNCGSSRVHVSYYSDSDSDSTDILPPRAPPLRKNPKDYMQSDTGEVSHRTTPPFLSLSLSKKNMTINLCQEGADAGMMQRTKQTRAHPASAGSKQEQKQKRKKWSRSGRDHATADGRAQAYL